MVHAFLVVAGNIERVTGIFVANSTFTENNATNIEDSQPGGIFDVGECAGAHISSASCVGVLNTTFEGNIGMTPPRTPAQHDPPIDLTVAPLTRDIPLNKS